MASGQKEHVIAFNDDEKLYLKDSHTADPCLVAEGRLGNLQNAILKQSWVETVIPLRLGGPNQRAADPCHCLPLQPPDSGGYCSRRNFFFSYPEDSFEAAGHTIIETTKLDSDRIQLWIGSVGRIVSGVGKFRGARGISVYTGSNCLSGWPHSYADQLDYLRRRDLKIRVSTFVKLVLHDDLENG